MLVGDNIATQTYLPNETAANPLGWRQDLE
jgi:hypothetical protein